MHTALLAGSDKTVELLRLQRALDASKEHEDAAVLALAMLLDAALGEPEWLWRRLPHPAVLMGRAVAALDRRLNHHALSDAARRARGVLALVLLVAGAGLLGWCLALGGPVVEILGAAVLLAQRSQVDHVRAVADGLRQGLPEGQVPVNVFVTRKLRVR